ncbi:MAG: tetratricopeptide repeat protein [Methanoregula sp.]|nr:tetratricopeptide repeat protein [Methanoregula sp.]
MIRTRISSEGKRAFFSHNSSGIQHCNYFILILLALWLFSTGIVSSATAADTFGDTGRVITSPENSSAINLTVTPVAADILFDSNISLYPPVDDGTTPEMNLTAIAAAENETYAYNLVDKGIECYLSGNLACSFKSFDAAHEILPNDSNIIFVQAQVLSLQKRYDEALEKIDDAIALKPDSAEFWYQKGIILNNMGKYFESGSSFDRAAELKPGSEFPVTDRFPINIILKNSTFIVLAIGFGALGCVFYFREIRQ